MSSSDSECRRGLRRSLAVLSLKAITALLVFMAATNLTYAVNLLAVTPATVTLSCTTTGGPGTAATIVVKPLPVLTGVNTIVVSLGTLPPGVVAVTTPGNQTLAVANQAAGIAYTLNYAVGCVGATTGTTTPTFRVAAGGTPDFTVNVNSSVTATTSGLTATPTSIALTCSLNTGTYVRVGSAKTVSVTSAATGGTPWTVDTVTNAPAAWLTVTPTTGGTATGTAQTFTVFPDVGCGTFASGTTNTTTVHLLNAPGPDKNITVTLSVVPLTPLTFTPAAPKLTYVKTSLTPGYVDVNIASASNPAPFFAVDTTSLPIWLTVDSPTGRTPKSLRFSTTSLAETLAPGTYSSTVLVKVSAAADLLVPISMLVTNTAPKLSFAEGVTRNINWTIGQPAPTPAITVLSSDSPISYVATTGGALLPTLPAAQKSGLAYSFGTPIAVTFDSTALASAQPGTVLSGTVSFAWGTPVQNTVVTFNVSVLSPGATLTSISPASLPTAAGGQSFTLGLSGTGFIPGADPTQRTKVGIVVSNVMIADNNISWNVINSSSIVLTINVPVTADANLPFSPTGAGGNVVFGVCNPQGGACSVPTSAVTMTIGNGPIIQVLTSASSYIQVNPGSVPSTAPYDIMSLFGTNFCTSGGTGCSSGTILYGAPDSALMYPLSVSPDAPGATKRSLSVKFQTHAGTPVSLGFAPILFATNNQINVLVPSGVFASIGTAVDVVVSFGYGSGATLLTSATFPVNITATNPGVFTVGADGQGQAAALKSTDYSLISTGHEAGTRSTALDSDTILLYVTGLGAPDSIGDNASTGAGAWSADCITPASYLTALNSQTGGSLTTVDGLIVQSSLLNTGRLSPCVLSSSADLPVVTIGGVASTVSYAGWVANSVAGLYQLNVKLPGSTAAYVDINGTSVPTILGPTQLPVVITSNSVVSQAGVTMWVAPRLKVVAPTVVTGTVGIVWGSPLNLVIATEGTSTYHYALTSGVLPTGLLLNGNTGAITGTPAANTAGAYIVTVTATDSANIPVKDSVTFTLTIAGGLVVSLSTPAPTGTFGSANATLTTATATGGIYPYAYSITSPVTLPTGMTINASTGVIGISALTPGGTYHVTVRAADSDGTPVTGTVTFDIVVSLLVARTTPTGGTAGQINAALSTVSATGNTGSVTYTLDAASLAVGWITINASTGAVGTTSGAVASTKIVVVTATDGTAAPGASAPATGTSPTITLVIT